MLDIYRIKDRIAEIRKRLNILSKKFKGISKDELLGDESLNAEAERHLEVAIQACLDIASHLVSSLGLDKPEVNSHVYYSLAKENIIPGDFADIMVQMTGYRNILAHEYLKIDKEETYKNINSKLEYISKFTEYVEELIKKVSKTSNKK
ncbi:MAG TPA: DUF86 domain-containing protein [Patescibacteria group bacterium]